MYTIETSTNPERPDVRYRWVYDERYVVEPAGDDPESLQWFEHDKAKMASGEWIAMGCIAERRCPCCGQWVTTDSLWGIVAEGVDDVRDVEDDLSTDLPTTPATV